MYVLLEFKQKHHIPRTGCIKCTEKSFSFSLVKGHKYNKSRGEIYFEVASQSCESTKEADGAATNETLEGKCCQTQELPQLFA